MSGLFLGLLFAAASAALTDTMPINTTFVSETQTSGPTFTFSTPAPNAFGGTVSCTTATLNKGDMATTCTNTASVTSANDPNPDNDTAIASVSVATADVGVTKSGPGSAIAGGPTFNYTVTLSNNGPDEALDASFSDTMPPTITLVSVMQTSGPSASCSSTTTSVTCTIASMLNGESASFTLTARADANGAEGSSLENTARASSSTTDPNTSNDSSSMHTTISARADIVIVKSGPATALAGNNINYSITVTNNGPSDARSAGWADTLPAGTTFVSLTQNAGPSFGCTTGTPLACQIAALTPGASASFTIVAHVTSSATAGSTISNTANASSFTVDPTPGNNSSSATTTVGASIPALSPLMLAFLALTIFALAGAARR